MPGTIQDPDGHHGANLRDMILGMTEAAGHHFARKFNRPDLRDEIVSETRLRLLAMIDRSQEPFENHTDDEASRRRITNFSYGVANNVAHELIRSESRHARLGKLGPRAAAALNLEICEPDCSQRIALDEAIESALDKLRDLPRDIRETLVAEEVRKNDYEEKTINALCASCSVSSKRVTAMMTERERGEISPEAWRQRVHRVRMRAKEMLGESGLLGALLIWVVVAGLATGAVRVADSSSPMEPQLRDLAAKKDDSTQNGNRLSQTEFGPCLNVLPTTIASTQNGKPKKKK